MCSTFSRLHQEEPLNIADEIIQTEEVQISVGSRKKINKLGVHITEMYEEKKKVINENMQIPSIVQTDVLAWSREKIAEIKANTSHITENRPEEKNGYEYRIPITKSTQELFLNKRKKSPNNSRINGQARPTTQTKKFKKETTSSKSENSKPVDNNKLMRRTSTKPTKGASPKKVRELNKLVPISNKMKNSKAKEKINEPIQNLLPCVSNTCGICITKLDMYKRKNSKCITKDEEFENHIIQQRSEKELDEIRMNVSDNNLT